MIFFKFFTINKYCHQLKHNKMFTFLNDTTRCCKKNSTKIIVHSLTSKLITDSQCEILWLNMLFVNILLFHALFKYKIIYGILQLCLFIMPPFIIQLITFQLFIIYMMNVFDVMKIIWRMNRCNCLDSIISFD